MNREIIECGLISVPEAARLLGVKECTIRAWLLRRLVSKVRVGRRTVRIPRSEIERLIIEGFTPAREPRP
jgi:excisionase family DNA binding protein